ncbi:MAG TPA: NAD(P)-dependent oxidoreductase [Gaiellales bacterium]|nr:NAD(P)-dependent oxidoreductase [Gaiellales bacterium]
MTGAGGQVGLALRDHLPRAEFLTHAELDVTDADAVRDALRGADLVVHAAAMTNVDGCELDPERAEAVNAGGAANVAAAGVRVIHLSTDYVFSGNEPGEYAENAPTGPLGAYGRSKLGGERAVLGQAGNLVVRTSWVYGEGRNFFRAILAAEAAGRDLRVVDDQRGRPTWAGDVACAIAFLVGRDDTGVLHVTGAGEPCTWADLAEIAVGHPVERITSEEFGAPAPRPRNSVLSLGRARSLGVPLADWRDSVMRYLEGER